MAYIRPTIPEFKAQFMRDFPYAVPLAGGGSGAALSVTLGAANGGIASVSISSAGSGYPATTPPTAIVFGGGGYGASITLGVTAGAVATATLTSPGFGYTATPPVTVYVSNGLGDNTDETKVTDFDIAEAVNAAQNFNISEALFSSQAAFTYAMNLLAAHYLAITLRAAGTGLGGKADWVTSSRGVGHVSETYSIPDRILRSPFLSRLTKTSYGAQFLELVSVQLVGNMGAFHRDSLP